MRLYTEQGKETFILFILSYILLKKYETGQAIKCIEYVKTITVDTLRAQSIYMNSQSSAFQLFYGVPRGSVLGSLLFTRYSLYYSS
jgi:hypothetical protein